jgi:NadR type nicotinamide-nucleotide adenylyltransferase
MVKKIVIIGPESTGKSTLCAQLAAHFTTLWCPEYARTYLETHGNHYNYDQLLDIAKGQLALEATYTQQLTQPLLFVDTDMYVMKVWCEYVFGKCHHFILEQIVQKQYDLYLLCNVDLPWTKDNLREYPDEQPRKELYQLYKDLLINQTVPWVEISGLNEARLQIAIEAVETFVLQQ